MRRILLFLSLLSFLSFWVFAQNVSNSPIFPSAENTTFVNATDDLDTLKMRKLEVTATIKLEKERVLDEVKKKNAIQGLIVEIDVLLREIAKYSLQKSVLTFDEENQSQIIEIDFQLKSKQSLAVQKILSLAEKLEYGSYDSNTIFPQLQYEFSSLKRLAQNMLVVQDKNIAESEKKRQVFLEKKNQELYEININIDRLQEIRSKKISTTAQQIGWYLFIFWFIYIFRITSSRLLVRFGRDFSKPHQEALVLTHRLLFHVLFIWAILMIFSAEFMSFLPFLAILSTAIGFALRDVVSSFIGWFVIGANSGYQEGDLVEFDAIVGRVSSVTPLLTTIEEYGPQWFTGKVISFPNKTIFEKNIKNWSHGSDFLLISMDFLLDYTSDIARAKEVLMEVVGYKSMPMYYNSQREINFFKSIYNFTDDDLKPQIHALSEHRWIILRVRTLVHIRDRLEEQSRITETFITRVQKEKNISLHQI